MKIATWNVNSLKVRFPQVKNWLLANNPDILALQELKQEIDFSTIEEFNSLGFNFIFNDQKRYNGVAIISKHQIKDIVKDIPKFEDEQKRVLAVTINNIRIINIYAVNGFDPKSSKFLYKEEWYSALYNYLKDVIINYEKVIVLGDFNIAPSYLDVYDEEKLQNTILCSPKERYWYEQLLSLGFIDSVRYLAKSNKIFTWWSYQENSFRRNLGFRIDHILISNPLKQYLLDFFIDKELRKVERPSDHVPVLLKLNL